MAGTLTPPLPDGFVLEQPSAPTPQLPPLPDGFVLSSKFDNLPPVPHRVPNMVSTTAGGKPNSFTGNPFATAGEAVAAVPKAIGQGFGVAGDVAKAVVADVADPSLGFPNVSAYAQGQPLPIDQTVKDASDEAKFRGEFPTAATVANISLGLAKTTPKIAALTVAPEGLLAQSIAAGGIFGLQDDGSFSPKEAVIGALMPGVGKLARIGVASALTKGIESGATALENPLAQKLIEAMGEQAALNAYQTAVNTPQLIEQYKQDPNEAYATLAEMVGSNLAFGLLGVPHLSKDVPSATQDFILNHSEKYAAMANRVLEQTLSGDTEALKNNPDYQKWLNAAAVSNLSLHNLDNPHAVDNAPPKVELPAGSINPAMADVWQELRGQVETPQRRYYSPSSSLPPLDLLRPRVQPTPNVSPTNDRGLDEPAGVAVAAPAKAAVETGAAGQVQLDQSRPNQAEAQPVQVSDLGLPFINNVQIQKPDGSIVVGDFRGYQDFSKLGGGMRPIVGYEGSHGGLKAGDKILTPIPAPEEWGRIVEEAKSSSRPSKEASKPTGVEVTAGSLPVGEDANGTAWFHGGPREITEPSSSFTKIESLFGSGFYMTDNPHIAKTYAKNNGVVHEVKVKIRKALNFERPLPKDAATIIENAAYPQFKEVVSNGIREGKTGAEIWKDLTEAVTEESHGDMIPVSEYVEMFQAIEGDLRNAGYDAITHIGGLRAGKGKQLHRVLILLDPSSEYSNTPKTVSGIRKYEPNQNPQLAIDTAVGRAKIPSGEGTTKLPPSPVQEARAAQETSSVANLEAALQKAYGWTQPLARAEVGIGTARSLSDKSTQGDIRAVASLEAALGKRIVGVTSAERLPWHGVTLPDDPNTLYINVKSGMPLHAIVGHEFIESMLMTDPPTFNAMFDALKVDMRNISGYREQMDAIYKREGIASGMSLSKAYKEVMADFVGDQFTKPEFWEKLGRKNPTLFESVAEMMKNFLAKIINALTPFKSEKFFTDVEKAQDVVIKAIEQHRLARARQGAGVTEPGFAINAFKSQKALEREVKAPGTSPEGQDFLNRLGQVQSGDIHPELKERIVTRAFTEPTTPAERVAKGYIKKTADLITVHDVPRDFDSLADPAEKQAAATIVVQRHLAIRGEDAKIQSGFNDAQNQVEAAVKAMDNYNSKSLGSDMLSAMATGVVKDYTAYLDNIQRVASPNDNLRATAALLKAKAGRQVGEFLVSHGAIEKALQEIADNRSIKTGAEVEPTGTGADVYHPSPSNAEFLNRVRFAGPLKGVNAEAQLLLLGGQDGHLDGVDPLLARIKDLPDKIEAIRKINDGASEAMRQITDFQKAFNPQGKAVGVGTAMKRYASLILKAKAADTILQTLDANYAKARNRLLGAAEAQGLVRELLDAPNYKQAVNDAATVTGIQFTDALSPVDGEFRTKGPYPEAKHDYIITRTPTKEALESNLKESQALLTDIEQFLDDPNADPVQKASWQAVHDFVKAQWIDQLSSPIENPGVREPFDLKHWVPGLQPVRTMQNLVRDMIGGRETYDLRRSMDALDYARSRLQTLEMNPNGGIASITLKLVAGAESHQMDLRKDPMMAERYRADILNPIANSLQHFGAVALKVGDFIPGTATKITGEDMAALQSLSNFEQGARKIIERDAHDIFNTGTKIMDEYGGIRFSRMSSPTGPMMLTRFWNDDVTNWVDQNWRTGMVGNQRDAQIAKLTDAMWNDRDMFRTIVNGYVFETNPDFAKLSSFAKEFRQLASDARKDPTPIESLANLVDAIAPMRPDVSREDLATALKTDLEREAVRIMDNVSGEVSKDLNPKGNTAIDRAVASSLKTGGAFLDPRGKMLAPQTFYTIAKVAKTDVMTTPAVAVTIGRVRVLQGLKELLAAYEQHRDALELEIQKASASNNPNPIKRSEKIAQIDRLAKLGDIRYAWSLLRRRCVQMRQQVDYAEANLTKFSEIFTPGVSRTMTAVNRGLTMQLLSSPGAVIRNLFGATYTQDLVLNAMFGKMRDIAMSPLHVTYQGARVVTDRTLRLIDKVNPTLGSVVRAVTPFKNELADWIGANREMVQRLTDSGQLPPADILNRIGAKRAIGFGGEIMRPGTEVPGHLQFAQWAMTTPVGLLHEMMFPRAFDNFANTVMGHRAVTIMLRAFSHAEDIRNSRVIGGAELDPASATQRIAAKEIGMNETQFQNFRALLEPIGSLEKLMFDYGNRMAQAKAAGQPVDQVGMMTEPQMGAALLAFGKLGNVLSETNTPAVWRIGKVYRIFGTFGSWPANFFDQLMKLVPNGIGKEQRKMFLPLGLAVAAVTGVSIAIQEFRRQFLQAYTGKQSSEPGLANVMDDPTSMEATRYMLGALSGGVPYLSYALGQSTDTQSLFDASRVVPLLGLTKDVISMSTQAIQTGDVSKGLIDFSNRYLPLYAGAINRTPMAADYIESKNVGAALRAATPRNIEMRAFGGGTANPTGLSRYLREAETAAFGGDNAGAQSSLNQAIQFKMAQKGISRAEAMNELRQSIGARQPEMRVYGRTLAPTERQAVLSRMDASQLRTYHGGQQAYTSLLSLLPHQSTAKGKSMFKGVKFKNPKMRKYRSFS